MIYETHYNDNGTVRILGLEAEGDRDCQALTSIKREIDEHGGFVVVSREIAKRARWRSVERELPEAEGDYLVFYSDRKSVAHYSKGSWLSLPGKWELSATVTHWMPLPEGPA